MVACGGHVAALQEASMDEQVRTLCESFGGRARLAALLYAMIAQVNEVVGRIRAFEAKGDHVAAEELRHMICGTVSLIPLNSSEHMSTDALDAWVAGAAALRRRLSPRTSA
jgi:hypothetical protein